MTESPYRAILPPLLDLLHWHGDVRHIHEACPAHKPIATLEDFTATIAHLGFHTKRITRRQAQQASYPLVFIDRKNNPHLIGNQAEWAQKSRTPGRLLTFQKRKRLSFMPQDGNALLLFERFLPLFSQILLISLLVGLVALAPTFYNMALYDHIIASGTMLHFPMLATGVFLALVCEMMLRHFRNKKLSYLGGRIDHFFGCAIFERLLYIPPLYTERASVSAQLARLRDFESVRDFFTGPLATLLFEMPLVILYMAVMACLGGPLALVPLALVAAYAGLYAVMKMRLERSLRRTADAMSKRHEFLLETLGKLRAIRLAGMESAWSLRYQGLTADAALASFRAGMNAQLIEVGSYVLMMACGVATLGFGVVRVVDQAMSVGALVATMILIWRVVAPMQLYFASLTRLRQLRVSSQQAQRLLVIPPERDPDQAAPMLDLTGRITFSRVSLRYGTEAEPALLGVSFDIIPGQICAIRGPNGSGKSSILKLVLGLYQPQGGTVRIDEMDIRQFDPLALRQSIAYVPQQAEFFPGTILENMLFLNPSASHDDCMAALQNVHALDDVQALPNGLDTLIHENDDSLTADLKQKLNLARAWLRPASILLFDEALHVLGHHHDQAFENLLNTCRGKRTVLYITHREDYLRMADRVLVMEHGELTHMGSPVQIMPVLKGKNL